MKIHFKSPTALAIFLVVSMLLTFSTCEEETLAVPAVSVETTTEECLPYNPTDFYNAFGEPLFRAVGTAHNDHKFNAGNTDEIFFTRRGEFTSTQGLRLAKYNLVTKEETTLITDRYSHPVHNADNGKIVMNMQNESGFDVYTINDDGTQLRRLTFNGNCFFPIWNPDGTQIMYSVGFTQPTEYVIMTTEGVSKDTIFHGGDAPSSTWEYPDKIIHATEFGLSISNPITGTTDTLYTIENPTSIGRRQGAWLNDEEFIWCTVNGIFRTNVTTTRTEVIRRTCRTNFYSSMTYAPDKDLIITTHVEYYVDDDGQAWAVSTPVTMHPDGTNEQPLIIE